jgi:hypothetical protein
VNIAFSLENFKKDFADFQWLPLEKGVEEFIEAGEQKGTFQDPGVEIIDDLIIQDWKMRLAGW